MKINKMVDVLGWAYSFIAKEQNKYSRHEIIGQKHDEFTLDCDLIYLHSPDISKYASQIVPREAKKKGIPVIGAYSGWVSEKYEYADCIVCISPQTYWEAQRYYKDIPILYIPECIDNEFFNECASYDYVKLGWVGRPCKIKRPHILDQLIYPVSKQQDWGKKYFVKERTLEPMKEYYKTINVLICCSLSEAASRAIMEAMACGCVVISTDVGNTRAMLPSKYIVKTFPDYLTVDQINSIIQSLSPEQLKIDGQLNKQKVNNELSWKSQQYWIDDVFELIANKELDKAKEICDNYYNKYKDLFLQGEYFDHRSMLNL